MTIKVGSWQQIMAIGSAVLVAGWLGIATTSLISGNVGTDTMLSAKQKELARLEQQLAAARLEASLVKADVSQRTQALETRQAFLTALMAGKADSKTLAGLLPREDKKNGLDTVRALVAPLGKTRTADVSADTVMPGVVAPLRAIENQQLAMVDRATGAAEARLRDTQALIRRLGLDPSRFAAVSEWRGSGRGVGGPFIPATDEIEPRFKDLFISWRRLETMQASLASIPALVPVKNYRQSSTFGRRFDPFNGRVAIHAGMDMAGSTGEPIYASANGKVSRAGSASGYGNLVELDHGKGIETRYGHLSKVLVKPGETVRQGQLIGRMGSTGRSTGTHLHYEVRVDGQAVNPQPFLEASAYVLAAQSEAERTTGPIGPVLDDDVLAQAGTPAAGGMMMTPIRPIG
ncbi:peptidoglycan DD-metalloendopeptidase family protein [Polymorphobacter sp.]|uniref:peptidoglycan DD-metalloendopeptidase family protein n=1 Tax=Polymorphobacter sp. TaxID=1909290 RepID=UPI003F721974